MARITCAHITASFEPAGTTETIRLIRKYSKHNHTVLAYEDGYWKKKGDFVLHTPELMKEVIINIAPTVLLIHTGGGVWCEKLQLAKELKERMPKLKVIEVIHNAQKSADEHGMTDDTICISKLVSDFQGKNHYIASTPVDTKPTKRQGKYVGWIGRIDKGANIFDVIEVANRTGLPFLIAGDGSKERMYQLKEKAKDNVRFVGMVYKTQGFYEKLRVLLYPSTDESLCLSIVQAFAAKIPVITNQHPATILYKDCFVKAITVDEMVEQVSRVYQQPDKPIINSAYDWYLRYAQPIKQIMIYDKLISKLCLPTP